ncbi:MAG: hypothetical protein ABIP02_06430 [Arenimonas sp.]
MSSPTGLALLQRIRAFYNAYVAAAFLNFATLHRLRIIGDRAVVLIEVDYSVELKAVR